MGMESYEVDVLVVGSGAGGLTAAVVAADQQAEVLVVEKSNLFGGTTATSGGVIWVPGSHLAEKLGQKDTVEEAMAYICSLAGDDADPARIRAFVEAAPRMLKYLETHADIRYDSIPYTDYHAEHEGGKLGYRSHDPRPFDGRALEDEIEALRPTHASAMLFGRINWTAAEAGPMITRGKGWMRALLKVLWRYYSDIPQRLRSPRPRFLTMGNALVARLKIALNKRGVPLWLNAPMVELFSENGRVAGAVVNCGGKPVRVRARKGVILAAGGFERNRALRQQNLGGHLFNADWSGSQPNNTGEALEAALKLGAATERLDAAWWAPTIVVPGEDRARPLFFERSLPGSIIVNQAGKRFTNEAASYHIVGQDMAAQSRSGDLAPPAYMIFDRTFRSRYPVGPVMPGFPKFMLPRAVRGLLVEANSWEEMARKLDIPETALRLTVERFNANAAKGEDPDFGRGHNAYDRYYGDMRAGKNPNLAPLVRAPFYAMPVYPGDIGTSGGLVTDRAGAVLNRSGERIEGLYAIGNTTASVMGRSYPGAGATIAPAMTFGYLAALDATGRHGADDIPRPATSNVVHMATQA